VTVYETGPSNVCPLKLQMLLRVMSSDARLRRHQREAGSVERVTELAKRWEYEAFVPNNWHAFRQRKLFGNGASCIIMFATQKIYKYDSKFRVTAPHHQHLPNVSNNPEQQITERCQRRSHLRNSQGPYVGLRCWEV
jgi:hypothetical protein